MAGDRDLLGGMTAVVAGTHLHGFVSAIAAVFRDFGARVVDLPVWAGREPKLGYLVDRVRFLGRAPARAAAATDRLLGALRTHKPQLVFITRPDWIDLERMPALREASPAATWIVWLYDPVRRYPHFEAYLPYFDHTFLYSAVEAESLARRHPDLAISYLPAGADDRYHPLRPAPPRRFDVYFNGALASRYYDDRVRILDRLALEARRGAFSMCIESPLFGPVESLRRRARFGAEHPFVAFLHNKPLGVPPERLNVRYQEAGLVLGHMALDPDSGLSVRMFEIMATGAPQIVNHHPDLDRLFAEPPFAVFRSDDEATDLAERLLRDDRESARLREQQLDIRERHLLRARLARCLEAALGGGRLSLADFREPAARR